MASRRSPGAPYDFGFVTGMGRLLMAHPRIGGAFMNLFGAIMFAPGPLSRQEREMIAAVAASAQTCFY
jgi:alkylhydroperoxidase/carboxymuconolactone decarboxylase family protein YurZ